MKTLLWITINIIVVVNVCSVPVSRSKRQIGDEPAVVVLNNTPVCVVNRAVYNVGDLLHFKDPCEICRCRPPGFACTYVRCAKRKPAQLQANCKLVEVKGQCCPQYQCIENEKLPATTEAAALENRNDLATEAAVQNVEIATLEAKQAEEEEAEAAATELQRQERQEDLVTQRSDDLFTGKSEDLVVTSRNDELATGKSEELVSGRSDVDFGVITSEPPQAAVEGKADDLTPKSADLVLEPTEEPKIDENKATEKEGRSEDEENQTAEARSDDGTEKPAESRRRRSVDDGLTQRSDDEEEEATPKSADDNLTPKSAEDLELTPKSADELELTQKSVSEELTEKSADDDDDSTTLSSN